MFKKKNGRRMLSAFLALCTVFSLCVYALPVYAVDSINGGEITSEEIITENAVAGEKLVLNADDVPELIDFQTAKDKGHVLRLRQKESDAHTVIFLNDDNTETMYIFAEPVKYTDSDGNVKDKKRTLTLENGKYTMAENDVQVSFPTGVNDGISVSKGDVNITMIPVADTQTNGSISATATAELVNNKVSYSNVFGTADLQYTPLYSGFKEDIILESYTGVSEFNFIVYTNGLTPVKNENGSVSFIDPETNSAVAEMMQVVCYDAEQDFAPGDVRITTIKENGIYGFTVIADVNFLTAEDTLYPVSVDPTITLTGTTAIEDAVVYSGKPNSNYGSYHYNSVGYVDDSYKNGQLYVKFPTLANEGSAFSSLTGDDITSATFSLYTSSRGTGTEVVKIYQINHTTWEESTITPNNLVVMMNPTYLSETTLPSGSLAKTDFNVTNAVKAWANGALYVTPDRGLYLCNAAPTDPDMRRSFLSTEYATANNTAVMPCLVIDYGNDLSASIVNLEEGATQTLTVNDADGYTITWNSSNTTVATVNSSGKITALKAGTSNITATLTNSAGGGRTLTCVAYVYKPNGVYYIRNAYSEYRLTVENAKISNLSNVHISTDKSYSTSNPANGLSQMWKLEYQSAGRYRLYPMHKMQSALYASGSNIVIYNSSSASTSNVIWSIEYSSPGYIIRKGGSSDFTLQLASASTAAPLEVVATLSTTSTSAKWLLDEIASPPHGILLYDTTTQTVISSTEDNHPTKYVAPGETLSLTNLKLATSIYADNMSAQSLNWSVVEGTDIATVDGNGNITGVSPGTAVICGQRYVKNDLVQVYITIIVTPVANGTYFIRSRESGKYIDIENQNMEDETILHQWDFHAGDSQRWIFTHLSDGYYSIRSKNSTNSYYLGVKDDSSSAGAAVVLQNGAFTDGMRWRIEITSDGAYRFRSKVCASTEISLALETNSDSNGIDIRQYSYGDDDDYCDEWEIGPIIDLGLSTDNYTSGCVQEERSSFRYANVFFYKFIFNELEYNDIEIQKIHHYNNEGTHLASKNDFAANGAISNDIDFMIFIGHGGQASDSRGNHIHYSCAADGTTHTNNCTNEVYNAYTSEMRFGSSTSDLRWVWLYTCNFLTTNDHVTEDSLREMMTGAHIVMGYASRSTLCDAMAKSFAEYLHAGEPIIDAYFMAGHHGEASIESAIHYQRVLYIPQAANETIYSQMKHYDYNSDDVLIITREIHSDFS